VNRGEIAQLRMALEFVLSGRGRGEGVGGSTVADRARKLLCEEGVGRGEGGGRRERMLEFVLERESGGVVGLCPWRGGQDASDLHSVTATE
jgi:hypothetical protein